jgi:hypothetical protein
MHVAVITIPQLPCSVKCVSVPFMSGQEHEESKNTREQHACEYESHFRIEPSGFLEILEVAQVQTDTSLVEVRFAFNIRRKELHGFRLDT